MEAPILWPLMQRTDSLEKTLMLGKIEGVRRRGQQRMRWLDGITYSMDMILRKLGGEGDDKNDEMVGWHHLLDGHEFEKAPGVGDGQGNLACCM